MTASRLGEMMPRKNFVIRPEVLMMLIDRIDHEWFALACFNNT